MSKAIHNPNPMLTAAKQHVLDKYGIPSDGRLERIIEVILMKFATGLDEKFKAYELWMNGGGKQIPDTHPRHTSLDYPGNCLDLLTRFNFNVTPDFDQLLKVEMGRQKVMKRAHKLIRKHLDEIPIHPVNKPALTILGTIIGQSLTIYRSRYPERPEPSFDKNFPFTYDEIRDFRQNNCPSQP